MRLVTRAAAIVAVGCLVLTAAPTPGWAALSTNLRKYKQNGSYAAGRSITPTINDVETMASGHVFAACSDNKIRKYTSGGSYLSYIGLNNVVGVARDGAGDLWAVNETGGVWQFNQSGYVMRHWDTKRGGFRIGVDQWGYVYVLSLREVAKFKTNGTFVRAHTLYASPPASGGPTDLELTAARAWVADSNGFVSGMDLSLLEAATTFSVPGVPIAVSSDSAGHVYTTSQDATVRKYKQSGSLVSSFTPQASWAWRAISVDGWGYIWLGGDPAD